MESRGPGLLPYHLAQGRILRGIQRCTRSHVRCIPEGISFVDAATLPCVALTANCALYRRLHVPRYRFGRSSGLAGLSAAAETLVQVEKIRPTAAEQIALEAIPKALERLAEEHVRGKIVARMQR